ncbi:O-antigen ligase family protein [Marinilactibacillus psychrotolerans]|uniref:O-antigen ligase family protein n=1 Tax=Marinilactibacillus psychrotolerans TaxID=191770 RepID=UPI003885691C
MITTFKSKVLSRDLYRKVFVVLCLLYFMPSTLNLEYYPLFVAMGWGGVIVLNDLITDRIFFKNKYWKYLVAVIIVYILSIAINFDHALIRGIYNLIFLIITLYVIFPIDNQQSETKVFKNLSQFNDIFIVVTLIAAVISLGMFIINLQFRLESINDLRQGFFENRLFGVYTSPNVGSVMGFISVMGSLINNLLKRNSMFKFSVLYITNLIVQLIYFVLSSSRGTTLIISAAVVMFFLFVFLPREIQIRGNKKRSIIMVILVMVGFFNISSIAIEVSKDVLAYVPATVEEVFNLNDDGRINDKKLSKSEIEVLENEKVVIQHSPENAELSSGRFSIWRAGLKVIKQYPLFGVTDTDLYRNKEKTSVIDESKLTDQDISELKRSAGNMHNMYLQTLITTGIIGFLVLAIYLIRYLFDISKYLVVNRNDSVKFLILITLFITIVSFFFGELVESRLLYMNRSVVAIVFWYFSGILIYCKDKNILSQKRIEVDE